MKKWNDDLKENFESLDCRIVGDRKDHKDMERNENETDIELPMEACSSTSVDNTTLNNIKR